MGNVTWPLSASDCFKRLLQARLVAKLVEIIGGERCQLIFCDVVNCAWI
jgi:hypothetical protein